MSGTRTPSLKQVRSRSAPSEVIPGPAKSAQSSLRRIFSKNSENVIGTLRQVTMLKLSLIQIASGSGKRCWAQTLRFSIPFSSVPGFPSLTMSEWERRGIKFRAEHDCFADSIR